MRQWEASINRLIKEAALRKASERNGMSRIATVNTPSSSTYNRITNQSSHYSPASIYSHTSQSSTSTTIRGRPSGSLTPYDGSYSSGAHPHDGFDVDNDDDDSEDYSSSGFGPVSGRTPVFRRGPNSLSMPPEREGNNPVTERPRAQTEGTDGPVIAQWRSNGLPPMPSTSSSHQSPQPGMRPGTPRLNSNNMSASSYASDASFGSAVPPGPKSARPQLRNQYSSTRLRNGYESPNNNGPVVVAPNIMNVMNAGDYRGGRSATPTLLPPQPMSRSRSVSQPQAYIPPPSSSSGGGAPPMPPANSAQMHWNRDRDHRPLPTTSNGVLGEVNGKRGSGSSQSTGESSDYSPNSSSPITPYGSSESSLGGMVLPTSRAHSTTPGLHLHHHHRYRPEPPLSPPVKVKVHFHEDIFVIQVPRSTEYGDLVDKVGKKIRLCGPRRDDGPLRVKYKDEDGDMVSLGSTEDVQMAFEQYRPGGQVTLFVT